MIGGFLRTYFAGTGMRSASVERASFAFFAFFARLPHARGYSLSTSFIYSSIPAQQIRHDASRGVRSDKSGEGSEVCEGSGAFRLCSDARDKREKGCAFERSRKCQ